TRLLKESRSLFVEERGEVHTLRLEGRIFANLLEAEAIHGVPELQMICCNPGQLGPVTLHITRFLEHLAEQGHLQNADDIRENLPIMLVLPNGIIFEQMMQTFMDQIRESALLGRLPVFSEEMIQATRDRIVRGVAMQAGSRRGHGAEAVYVIEGKGRIICASGGKAERERVVSILASRDYPCKSIADATGARIEFDKVMISIVLNVGGLIHVVNPDGSLNDLRMGDLCADPAKQEFIEQITRAVFTVGQSCGAYAPEDSYESVWAASLRTIQKSSGHITSSVKAFRDALDHGLKTVCLMPTEEWILTPLRQYARQAGLDREVALFKSLEHQVQESMARAIRFRRRESEKGSGGFSSMKLATQRNINIELYEQGDDELVLVGTMLDSHHLIKLEIGISIEDEQIIRSKLEMIRSPFPVCKEVEAAAQKLVGLRIERGVVHEITARVGGRVGCSHIKEIATNIVYLAASHLLQYRSGLVELTSDNFVPPDVQFQRTRSLLRDSCLAYCQSTPHGLDESIGIQRVGEEHTSTITLGEYEDSLGEVLLDRAKRWGERSYLRYLDGNAEVVMSWSEFKDRVLRVASQLIARGIRPSDRICFVSENSAWMYILELATMVIGAITVPVFAGHRPAQVAYVLQHSRPRYVIVSGKHQLDKISRADCVWVEDFFSIDHCDQCAQWGAKDVAELANPGGVSEQEILERIHAVKPDDQCVLMYTSGTTGPPKGVRLCHKNLVSQQKAISLIWDVGPSDVIMTHLPWHHSFGALFERFMSLYSGAELCLSDSQGRDTDRLIDNWRLFDPTIFFSVPRVHDMVITRCREDTKINQIVFGGQLRFVFTAAASLPAHVEAAYREHDIPVREGWGLTETSPCAAITSGKTKWRSGCVGFPIPGVSIRIDATQEILIKGPNVMLGYYEDEEATSQVLGADGWFRTGDLGEFTRDGLKILGRKDGTFKLTTGEKVLTQRIENTITNESPFVSQTVIVGSGKDYVGAIIYPDRSRLKEWVASRGIPTKEPLDEQAVKELYASELERINPMLEQSYTRIRRLILAKREPSLERGELTPSSKIVRKKVLAAFRSELEEMFNASPGESIIEVRPEKSQRI
ncbi:hypothetical protein MNBD_PLANCTO03-1566, partial [hydrothermal vent metagenome]